MKVTKSSRDLLLNNSSLTSHHLCVQHQHMEKGIGSAVLTPVQSLLPKTNKTFFRSKHRPKKDSPDESVPKSYRSWCPESSQTPLKWLWCSGCLSPKSSTSLPPPQLPLTLYLTSALTLTPLAPAATSGAISAKPH